MAEESEENELVTLSCGDEQFQVPKDLLDDESIFRDVVSEETWREVLREEDREKLTQFLPSGPSTQQQEDLRRVLCGDNVRFGNPVSQTWTKINTGVFCPELKEACQELQELQFQQYQHNQKRYHMKLLQDILIARQEAMQRALLTGSLDGLLSRRSLERKRTAIQRRSDAKFRRIMRECRKEWGEDLDKMSSDEESTNQISDDTLTSTTINETHYQRMLQIHWRAQMRKKMEKEKLVREKSKLKTGGDQERVISTTNNIKVEGSSTGGGGGGGVLGGGGGGGGGGRRGGVKETASPGDFTDAHPSVSTVVTGRGGGGGVGRGGRRGRRERVIGEKITGPKTNAESKAVQEAYVPIDDGSRKEPPLLPVVLTVPLPDCQYMSFFSLLKQSFDNLHDRKGEISKVNKSVKTLLSSPEVESCHWLDRHSDWLDLVLPAIMYLSAEAGAVSSFDPLPFFLPIIEFRDRIDHWKWMGHERDSDLELLVLCNHWLETLHRSLEIVDYSDYEPPTPINMWTNFIFRPSTADEIARFREQESFRYSQPFKSYTYDVHGFEAAVGPVKGAKAYKRETGGRARGHALLISDRPTCVTILSLVRDAASRLPNGEGTRVDLCVIVRDSQFIHEHVSDIQLNNAVSGALDRLHYEKDPCVRYDSTRKVWIYLHRGRSEEDFERIQWACDMAAKQRKIITSRPRVKPRILLREEGGTETVIMEGGPQNTPTLTVPSSDGAGGSVKGEGGGGRGGRKGKTSGGRGGSTKSSSTNTSGGTVVVTSVMVGETEKEGVAPSPQTKSHKSKSKRKSNKRANTSTVTDTTSATATGDDGVVQPVMSVATPPSTLRPSLLGGAEWEESSDTVDLPFLSSLQPVGVTGHDSSSSWQSSDDEDDNNMAATATNQGIFTSSSSSSTTSVPYLPPSLPPHHRCHSDSD